MQFIIVCYDTQGLMMAVYCVSDLHGCKTEFEQLLDRIQFSSYDEMYIIGDVGDRGKNPIPLFQQIMKTENMPLIFGNPRLPACHTLPIS